MELNNLKKIVAERAVEEIKDGMVVGLGTGSTVYYALVKISEKIKSGELKNIKCIASSINTEKISKELGLLLISLNELVCTKNEKRKTKNVKREMRNDSSNVSHFTSNVSRLSSHVSRLTPIDIVIDGADEVDENKNLIKGGGGALTREKIIAQASNKFVVTVDESKLSKNLGEKFSVPIEVLKFAEELEKVFLESLGAVVSTRIKSDGEQFLTDEGNIIIDAKFNAIQNVDELAEQLEKRAGIVEHGLFRKSLVNKIFCAFKNGCVKEV